MKAYAGLHHLATSYRYIAYPGVVCPKGFQNRTAASHALQRPSVQGVRTLRGPCFKLHIWRSEAAQRGRDLGAAYRQSAHHTYRE